MCAGGAAMAEGAPNIILLPSVLYTAWIWAITFKYSSVFLMSTMTCRNHQTWINLGNMQRKRERERQQVHMG